MTPYAERTTVDPRNTLSEIERTIERYGCQDIAYRRAPDRVVIAFRMKDRNVKFTLPLPVIDDKQFTKTDTGRTRSSGSRQDAYEQAVRSRYRGLLLTIKAKLESVNSGIETFEEAFMAQIVLPDGRTMSEWAVPQIAAAYEQNEMPLSLGDGK